MSSLDDSLDFLRQEVPHFDALRRAASWPGPLARRLVGRRLRAKADPADTVAALRLIETDDRKFCRAVQLDGWRQVSAGDRAIFVLEDDEMMLWPVAARALVLFGGAAAGGADETASRRFVATGDDATTTGESDVQRFIVRTEAREDGGFRVVVRQDPRSQDSQDLR